MHLVHLSIDYFNLALQSVLLHMFILTYIKQNVWTVELRFIEITGSHQEALHTEMKDKQFKQDNYHYRCNYVN